MIIYDIRYMRSMKLFNNRKMLVFKSVLFCLLFSCLNAENICFKNVTVHGYNLHNHTIEKVIISSNNLKDELPKFVFDTIEMENENVAVLYENCISDMDSLKELLLKKNGIQEIRPGALKNLPALRIIKLNGNKLKTIKRGVFNNLLVSEIDLRENEIEFIEDTAFNNMPQLLVIRLTLNKLTKWNKIGFSTHLT
ncbi:hypothetical protein HHI36_013639 [Cryptolaemus montrouzieri]|uniref:Uncharacterized protein n=1 Tax=Cryptolaemus montrouzieri TaxID=559131 RepID=A0ABD2NJ34_9CUCU